MVHVLIGFAEALPAPEVVFSLLDAGHQVSVFSRTKGLPIERLPLKGVHVLPAPEQDASRAISALTALMTGPYAPDVILPLDDTALWLADATLGHDPRSAGASGAQANVALDKTMQIAAAIEAGLAVPQTLILRHPSDLDTAFDLPAIVKPAMAVRLSNGRLVKAAATYLTDKAAIEALKASLSEDMDPLLVQPLVSGVGEGVFGYATPDGVSCWSGHRRLRMMNPHGSGSSACVSLAPSDEQKVQISTFLAALRWHGPFMVELLHDAKGNSWFMELNGRMWGSLALARRQGLEYPAWAVAGVLDPGFSPTPPVLSPSPVMQRHLGREILHLLYVLRGPRSDFHRKDWPRFLTSLADVLRPARLQTFYNYDPQHPSFFLRDALWTVRRAFER